MSHRFSALGLDVGNRRIGVAGCDGLGLLATGLGVIHRQQLKTDIAELDQWIQHREAQVLVVGLPLLADGSVGPQAQKVERFMRAVRKTIEIPIEYVDERYTTVQAEWDLQEAGLSTRQQKGVIDQRAAAIILQQWLDRRLGLQSSDTRSVTSTSERLSPELEDLSEPKAPEKPEA